MLKVDTLRRQERELMRIVCNDNTPVSIRDKAYDMATALQWARGGCTWNPLTLLNDDIRREKKRADADQG
ncbi:hypothetical protein LCGC14_1129890 [marine sediment metagenome]|uniref:Uncharacterized protein n=1 Tax=marine sediment metagenome TaxID=412755 RepID=A0A0F9M1C6_9ZZZZ